MDVGEELLTIEVEITGSDEIRGHRGNALLIHFTGSCNCRLFQGKILPGGVDTQKEYDGKERTLSARYVMEGTDCEGKSCRIFVENQAIIGTDPKTGYTKPFLLTDSNALAFLETADLKGTISPAEKGVTIHIFQNNIEAEGLS